MVIWRIRHQLALTGSSAKLLDPVIAFFGKITTLFKGSVVFQCTSPLTPRYLIDSLANVSAIMSGSPI